jgi:hypothetical protein
MVRKNMEQKVKVISNSGRKPFSNSGRQSFFQIIPKMLLKDFLFFTLRKDNKDENYFKQALKLSYYRYNIKNHSEKTNRISRGSADGYNELKNIAYLNEYRKKM